MPRVQPYASQCVKNEKIKDTFKNFFMEVYKIKVISKGEEPSVILVKGRNFTHPRSNVIAGAPKRKRYLFYLQI